MYLMLLQTVGHTRSKPSISNLSYCQIPAGEGRITNNTGTDTHSRDKMKKSSEKEVFKIFLLHKDII